MRWISLALVVLVTWLTAAGTTHGYCRYLGQSTPDWVVGSRWVLPVCGGFLGAWLLVAAVRMLRMLSSRSTS